MLNLTSIAIYPSCVLKSYCMCSLVALLHIWIFVDFMSPILAYWLTKIHQKMLACNGITKLGCEAAWATPPWYNINVQIFTISII